MKPQQILKSESGMALGIIMVLMTLMAATTAIVMSDGNLTARLSSNKTNQQIQQRADIAQNLANFVLYSSAINQSVFDLNCLSTQVDGVQNPAHMGDGCLLHNRGQSSLDNGSPESEDHDYYPFKLKSPFSSTVFVSGTRTDPACYGPDGALCTTADCSCVYKAYTMYKPSSVPRTGLPVGGFGFSDPAITVKVKIVSTDLAQKIGKKQWSAETQVRLAEINSRQDPSVYNVCIQGGAIKPGYVKVAAKASTHANNGNGVPYEEDICVPAVGAKPCPQDMFQVGVTALGEPVCSGSRSPCGTNQVPVGIRDAGTNDIQIKCINAECRNRNSAVFSGGRAFGFISPKTSDTSAISCVLVEPTSACLSHAKNSLTSSGGLSCNTQAYTDPTPPNVVCSNPGACVPPVPPPTTTCAGGCPPPVGPTWNPSSTPCNGMCAPPATPTMNDFKPAFASRTMGCISCHAVINADVITDFGNGDPWYFGSHGQGLHSDFATHTLNGGPAGPRRFDEIHYHNNMYGDYIALGGGHTIGANGILNSMQITYGDLVIPANAQPLPVTARDAEFLKHLFPTLVPVPTPPKTLKAYINTFGKEMDCKVPRPGSIHPNDYICMFTGAAPKFNVREVGSVYIGAPTSAELHAVGARLPSIGNFRFKAIQTFGGNPVPPAISGSTFTGFTAVGGVGYKATGNVRCDGDVFIDDDIYMENVTIQTKFGCRMYVTGHVFIGKGLNIPSTAANTENLQITSSKSINLGLGLMTCNPAHNGDVYETRPVHQAMGDFIDANRDSHLIIKRYAWWDSETRSVNGINRRFDFAKEVYGVAKGFGALDAECTPPNRRNINLSRVLFNAPYIMNRFKGITEGSMIGEVIMNSLGSFPFSYHNVFTRVPVLPLLNYTQFLSINGDNGDTPRGPAVTPGFY